MGQPAPSFSAPVYDPKDPAKFGKNVSLSDYHGKWLVFFWYPLDFTFMSCPTEITALSDRVDEFRELGAEILGASTDSVHSHKAWASTPRDRNGIEGLQYPIIADMMHTVAADYGVLIEGQGHHLHKAGLFIIDPNGILPVFDHQQPQYRAQCR